MRTTAAVLLMTLGMTSSACLGQDKPEGPATALRNTWGDAKTIALQGLNVALSQPVLVARSKEYLWFPTLVRLEHGELLAVMSNVPDECVRPKGSAAWSADGGLTWRCDKPLDGLYSDHSPVRLKNGDRMMLPFYLFPVPGTDDSTGACSIVRQGRSACDMLDPGVTVTGWPRPRGSLGSLPRGTAKPGKKDATDGFGFNGQSVELRDGDSLAMLYGYFQGTKRYSLAAAESEDGRRWKIRSVIADEKCTLPGTEGPCESAVCRLKDGRLMCVFRMSAGAPYGQCWSEDEGRTWTAPVAMAQARSVQPSLAVMKDGTVALSGGRPGIFVWINGDGTGKDWQAVDVQAHHNTCIPAEQIGGTSSYTELIPLDEHHLLAIYDRIPHGWSRIPETSRETNSVWVVRVGLSRTGNDSTAGDSGR